MNAKKPFLTACAAALALGMSNVGAAPLSATGTIDAHDGKQIYENSAHRPWVEEEATYFAVLRRFLDSGK